MKQRQKRQPGYWQTGAPEQALFLQLYSAFAFANNHFSLRMQLHDAVKLDDVPARQMFTETSEGTFVLIGTSLPKHDNVKSILVNKDILCLETSDAGVKAIQQLIERGFLGRTTLKDGHLKLGESSILEILAPARDCADVFKLHIPWTNLSMTEIVTAIRAASLCVVKTPAQLATKSHTAQKATM